MVEEFTYRPADTQCPVCEKVFQPKNRNQGGGRRTIYCSPKCRSKDWARSHPAKRKATILKYEAVPVNQERKKLRSLKTKFKKYNITEGEFKEQLARQNYHCYGCQCSLDIYSARIDHDHTTGKVRGLLCNNCNWALGHLKDKRETLYRLSAYLEYDKDKTGVYLIGSLRNERVPQTAQVLRKAGFTTWDQWFSAGPEADDSFQKYHTALGLTFQEALKSEVASHIFYFDKAHLDHCDIGVLVMPAGKSGHLELGYMAGLGKRTYILNDGEPDRFDIMPQFATAVCNTVEELIEVMSKPVEFKYYEEHI